MPFPGKHVSTLLATVLVSAVAAPLAAQQPKPASESAQQLARDVIWNELHAREHLSHWSYLSTRTSSGQTLVQEQVETPDGPVSLVLARNGAPLSDADQQREARRVADLIHDPSAIEHKRHDQEQEESRVGSIMRIIPQALLFAYQGAPTGDIVRLSFRPDPAYVPSGYDARIVHALSGTMTVNLRQKRLVELSGSVAQAVEIGYGLLGSVSPGSTFDLHRSEITPDHWKTDLLEVHVHGRLLLLKGITKDEREVRSDFHPVAENLTLAQARTVLTQAAAARSLQAQLGTPAAAPAALAGPAVNSDP